MQTSAAAALLAGAGFIVPFMFVYGTELLLIGSVPGIAVASVTALVGVIALAASAVGYVGRRLAAWERLLALAGALTLVYPGLITDAAGLLVVGVVFLRAR
jgi:TRAP-type uncharacterized transport system fused permease subunit